MKTPQIGRIAQNWLSNWQRFPLASFFVHFGALCAIMLIRGHQTDETERTLATALTTCIIMLPLSLLTVVLFEHMRKNLNISNGVLLAMAGLLWWLLYTRWAAGYYQQWFGISVVLLGVASHLTLACVPFLRSNESRNFWEFNRQMLANIIIAFLYSLVLWLSLSAAILAVDELFEIDIRSENYAYWAVVCFGLVSSGYFMSRFPLDLEFDRSEMVFDKTFLALTKYILIPVTLLYFAILYAYGLKIAIAGELPKGWVSSLCIGFSLAGIVTWLLNYFMPDHVQSSFLAAFKRWFWPLTFPIIALLMVGIGRRLTDYGITEERYVVAMIAGLFLVNALYFSLVPRTRQRLWFLPLTVAIAALVTAIGPFDARSVSYRNQSRTLISLLDKAGLRKDGILVGSTTGQKVPNNVIEKLDYLMNNDRQATKDLLQIGDNMPGLVDAGSWNAGTIIAEKMGWELELSTAIPEAYQSFYDLQRGQAYPLEGVTMKLPNPLYSGYANEQKRNTGYLLTTGDTLNYLIMHLNSVVVDSFSYQPVQVCFEALEKRRKEMLEESTEPVAPITLNGKKHNIRFYPTELAGTKDENGQLVLNTVLGDFYLLK